MSGGATRGRMGDVLPQLADADRCPVIRTYAAGVAVRCSHARGHDRPAWQGVVWHMADEAPHRAAWPHKPRHCASTRMAGTAGGQVKVWCGYDPGHAGDVHEGVTGGMPTRWRGAAR